MAQYDDRALKFELTALNLDEENREFIMLVVDSASYQNLSRRTPRINYAKVIPQQHSSIA